MIFQKEQESEFKGFINFDDTIGIAPSASASSLSPSPVPSAAPQSSLQIFLSRVSGPLFWIFFSFLCFIFLGYLAYFAYLIISPFAAAFFPEISAAFSSLPASVSAIISLIMSSHLQVAAGLAFLNFIVSFADFYLSKKSIKAHLLSLFSPTMKPLLWMAFLFAITTVFGYFVGSSFPEIFASLFDFGGLPEDDSTGLMIYIFFNNVRVCFMLMFFGFIFGIFPFFIIAVNGFTVGIVAEYTIKNESLLFLVIGLLPHGIIEIPVILLGAGVGLLSGMQASRALIGNLSFESFKQSFIGMTWIFFLVVIPVLFIAAIIEVFVTSPLLGMLF